MRNSKHSKIIYLPLMGRIGNQLFQYAFAHCLQQESGAGTIVVVDTSDVLRCGWSNSLTDYELPNIVYVDSCENDYVRKLKVQFFIFRHFYSKFICSSNTRKQYTLEKRWQRLMNHFGLVAVERGYADYRLNIRTDNLLFGYFQSERFFEKYKDRIRALFDIEERLDMCGYPGIQEIRNRNTVCISIKIEHNYGFEEYDVCDDAYYRKAIGFITDNVEDPLFFLCSDNVDEARRLFFAESRADIICQPDGVPVSLTLCAMSKCRHYIINNTSFGWWAQFLCNYPDKIVVAPKKWKNNNDPVSIYDNQKGWHLI